MVINSIERHFSDDWSQTHSNHEYYEMVYAKGISVFEIEGIKVTVGPNDIIIIKPQNAHPEGPRRQHREFIVLHFSFAMRDSRKRYYLSFGYIH